MDRKVILIVIQRPMRDTYLFMGEATPLDPELKTYFSYSHESWQVGSLYRCCFQVTYI